MFAFLTIAYSLAQNLVSPSGIRLPIALLANTLLLTNISSIAAVSPQQQDAATPVLITEIFYNTPAVDAEQEWVEIANFGSEPIDLSNYKIGDEEQAQGKEGMLRFPQESTLNPGQTIVIAQAAQGFYALYGRDPDYEIADSDPQVPDMRRYALWSIGEFALANDGDELLLLNDRSRIVDTVNYGDKITFFNPAISSVYEGQSIERVPSSCDTNSAADWQPSRSPSPGTLNLEGECLFPLGTAFLGENLLPIGQIQGVGDVSPFVNQQVNFSGLVTGLLEDRNSSGITFYTIFLQDPPGHEDGDLQTSDAIAVFHGRQRPSYQIGDHLQVSGLVTEFYGLTEIDDRELNIKLESSDNPLPKTTLLDLPHDPAAQIPYWESHEGMLVTIAEPARVVGPTHPGCGFALIDAQNDQPPLPRLSADDRFEQPVLVLHNSDVDCLDLPDLKSGDLLSAVSGPLTYHFDLYKIILQNSAALEISAAPWSSLPQPFQPSADQFTIATFNLNNHFDGIKDMPASAEPVINAADLAVKQKKLAVALGKTLDCPTIAALQEIENETLLQSLVAETALLCGFTYEISHRESSDSRGLDLAFLTDPRRVQLGAIGLYQACTSLDTGVNDPDALCPLSESPLFGRPPLRVDLQVDGYPYTIINNHFKSKRGGEEETDARRLLQAQHIAKLVGTQLAADPQAAVIVLGDFNDYEQSPTMLQMTAEAGLVNALAQIPVHDRYTYIFDGVPQLIDGILVSGAVLRSVDGAMIMHANADYPIGLASNISANGTQFRASDHDLPLLLLNLPKGDLPVVPTPQLAPAPPTPPDPTSLPTDSPESDQNTESNLPLWPIALVVLVALALLLIIIWRKM